MRKHIKDFGSVPTVKFNRSKFDTSHKKMTSMNVGTLYPLDWFEVLPGDTFKSKMTAVTRVTSSFIKPVCDNLFMDIYSFFVPLRLVYDNAENVFGNPNPSAYTENELATIPTLAGNGYVNSGTVADYLGLPTHSTIPADSVSVLPFRAFALIYDQWFRNENVIDEMYVNKGNTVNTETLNQSEWSPSNYTGKLPKVGKRKDYFTSCLPNTQKGSIVDIIPQSRFNVNYQSSDLGTAWTTSNGVHPVVALNPTASNMFNSLGVENGTTLGSQSIFATTPAYIDLNEPLTVNDLRFSFQLQKMLERDARGGSRYNEYLLAHYGVYSPDSRLQFTECLGGGRIPLNIQQVAQTSQTTEDSPLANLAGYSQTVGTARFNKGFTEHGYVFTVGCIRQIHTYSQGIAKCWTRLSRNDFYDPLFANLGEQPVYTSELYYKADLVQKPPIRGDIFGYNEAWAEYRFKPNSVTGQMRPGVENSLDVWHFADYYQSAPTLSSSFTDETPVYVDRALTVPSTSLDQFMVDMWFDEEAIRVMPVYSVPGLIDHH